MENKGEISDGYHTFNELYECFKIPEVEKALFPFDGHTPQDVINRLKQLK